MITVKINGTDVLLPAGEKSYEDLAHLAGFPAGSTPSMTYEVKNGHGGILSPGDKINLLDGMKIDAAITGAA